MCKSADCEVDLVFPLDASEKRVEIRYERQYERGYSRVTFINTNGLDTWEDLTTINCFSSANKLYLLM